jgi:cellulose biosynthesis protein BcsQ
MVNKKQMSEVSKDSFAERLKEAFNHASNKFIADKLGVGKAAVTAYMQGRIPPYSKLIEVSRETNCNLHWLLTGEGKKLLLPADTLKSSNAKTIVIQGDKSGSGTSTAVLLIARSLAQKGYKTLILDKSSYPAASHLILYKTLTSKSKESSYQFPDLSGPERMILFSEIKDLHLAISLANKKRLKIAEKLPGHLMTFNEAQQYYDFVLVDSEVKTDPFACKDWFINDFLNNCYLLIPYDLTGLQYNHLPQILSYFNETKGDYERINFLGLFVSKYRNSAKKNTNNLASIIEFINEDKIFESRIRYHSNYIFERRHFKLSFLKDNHPVVEDYNKLTDELLKCI